MSGMSDNEYKALLEQQYNSLNGDASKIGPVAGMEYRGVPVQGDDVRNWDGDGKIPTGNDKFDDLDDLVKKITDDGYDGEKGPGGIEKGENKTGEPAKVDTGKSPLETMGESTDVKAEESEVIEEDLEVEDDNVVSIDEAATLARLIRNMKSIDEMSKDYDDDGEEEEGDEKDDEDGEDPVLDLDEDDEDEKPKKGKKDKKDDEDDDEEDDDDEDED